MFSKSFLNLCERLAEGFLSQVKWLNIQDINFFSFLVLDLMPFEVFSFWEKKNKKSIHFKNVLDFRNWFYVKDLHGFN